MATFHGLLVCGEVTEGKITTVTREIMNMGKRLSDTLHQPLSALLIGNDIEEAARAIPLGADKVYTVHGLPFGESHPDLYVAVITEACRQISPSIVIFGQTEMGREVAPRVASRLGTTVTMDCIELAIDPQTKRLLQSKPVYGGNAVAIWISALNDPQIVTVRPRAMMPAEPEASRKGEMIALDISIAESMMKGRLLETAREEVKGTKLEDAKVIIAGGGGIGSRDGFKVLEELAQVLGGTLGVTRVPCDEGWKPLSLEIGQTGHIVTPDLYVAIGLSGAPQHMAGCSGSKCIVAINKDPDAHIFREANFGAIGDYRQILPPMIEKCKVLKE